MKIYEIEFTAYELLEADGGGMRNNSCGFTHSGEVASNWKEQSSAYRSYESRTVKHRYCVTESLDDDKQLKIDSLIQNAKKKLSKEELDALISSIQKS
jgi:hypothetical protein